MLGIGIFFILLAAFDMQFLESVKNISGKLAPNNIQESNNSISLWEFVLPVSILAFGVNIISAWFLDDNL